MGEQRGKRGPRLQGGGRRDIFREPRRSDCCRLVSEEGSDWREIDRSQVPWVLQAEVVFSFYSHCKGWPLKNLQAGKRQSLVF